jgi:signal transduction histidine kinase
VRRRITEAIVGVTALILIALGIPLAIAVHQSILDSEVSELQATAARTLTEIDLPVDPTRLAAVTAEPDAPPPFSVYDTNGRRIFGDGPVVADGTVTRAFAGSTASTTDGAIVVATPITDDTTEQVVGVLRLTESLNGANRRSRIAWLIMGAAALVSLALGWLIANRVARRLSRPLADVAAAAARIGDSGTLERTPASGIAEIDTLSGALADSAARVNEALARERRFSADVSHQLRTPLTGIRLRLEAARATSDPALIEPLLDDVGRIEQTVEHLLAFARDDIPATSTVRLDVAARDAVQRWTERASAAGRTITAAASEPTTTRGSATSIQQILDVLIDNALRHGHGDIRVTQRCIAGGGAVDVSDVGGEIAARDADRIFLRHNGNHNGIGLALARSIAEAEGGRLLLANQRPTTFSLILVQPDNDNESDVTRVRR